MACLRPLPAGDTEAEAGTLSQATLMLFEDAELLLEEDKGFIAALATLATDSKVHGGSVTGDGSNVTGACEHDTQPAGAPSTDLLPDRRCPASCPDLPCPDLTCQLPDRRPCSLRVQV